MKKLLVLLSIASLVTWMVSFLALNYSPVVHIFLLLSILLFMRSVMTVENQSRTMTVESPGVATADTAQPV